MPTLLGVDSQKGLHCAGIANLELSPIEMNICCLPVGLPMGAQDLSFPLGYPA